MKPFRLAIIGCVVMVVSLFAAAALRLVPASDPRMILFAVFLSGFVCFVIGMVNLVRD